MLHICPRAVGLKSIMALEGTRIVTPSPRRLFESDSNNGPSPGHSSLVSDEVYICSSLLLMISWRLPYLAKGPTPDFNNGLGNDFNNDVSKQIRLCTGSGEPARNSQVTLTSLGQSTIRLRRYGWNTSKEGSLRRKTKKVEEIQRTNLVSKPCKQKLNRNCGLVLGMGVAHV